MRQSGPFEYQDLKGVAKQDFGCKILGEDGTSTKDSGCDGVCRKMAAGGFPGAMVSGGNGGRGFSGTRSVRRKWRWGISKYKEHPEEMAAGDFLVRWCPKKMAARDFWVQGASGENGGGGFPGTRSVRRK